MAVALKTLYHTLTEFWDKSLIENWCKKLDATQARPGLELFEKFIIVSELFKYMHNVPTDYKTYASPYM